MKTKTTAKPKKEFEMTIESELFEAWKAKRRTTDVKELVEITGKSESIIYRALQFGHVKNEDLSDTISNFYIERANKQKEQARKISGNE